MKKIAVLWGFLLCGVFMGMSVSADSGSGKIKIDCIGDSITYGQGAEEESSYPSLLEKILGDGYSVTNYGVCGATVEKDGDLPFVEHDYFAKSVQDMADIYVIMLGTNDSKKNNWNEKTFRRDLEELSNIYKWIPGTPEIYLVTPPAAFILEGKKKETHNIRNATIRDEIVPAVKDIAKKTDVHLIDTYEITRDHPEWYMDGVHPNADGYQEIAAIIASSIKGKDDEQ